MDRARDRASQIAMVAPLVAALLLLTVAPLVFAVGVSFTDLRLNRLARWNWAGLDQYLRLLGDERWWLVALLTVPSALLVAWGFNRVVERPSHRLARWVSTAVTTLIERFRVTRSDVQSADVQSAPPAADGGGAERTSPPRRPAAASAATAMQTQVLRTSASPGTTRWLDAPPDREVTPAPGAAALA